MTLMWVSGSLRHMLASGVVCSTGVEVIDDAPYLVPCQDNGEAAIEGDIARLDNEPSAERMEVDARLTPAIWLVMDAQAFSVEPEAL